MSYEKIDFRDKPAVCARAPHLPRSVSYASPGRNRVKRLFDLVVAATLCVVMFPVLIVIAWFIKLDSEGPILFVQIRRGLNGIPFKMYKFRTMYADTRDDHGVEQARCDDPRITRFGSFLRRSSLDELPQILNVLRGDMSLVGPRPHALGTHIDGCTLPEVCSQYAPIRSAPRHYGLGAGWWLSRCNDPAAGSCFSRGSRYFLYKECNTGI